MENRDRLGVRMLAPQGTDAGSRGDRGATLRMRDEDPEQA